MKETQRRLVIMRGKKYEFDLSNKKELTGVNGTGDFFWTGHNRANLGCGDIVIRRRVSGDWL